MQTVMKRIGTWIREILGWHRCCADDEQFAIGSRYVKKTIYQPVLPPVYFAPNEPVAKPDGTLDKSEGSHATCSTPFPHSAVSVVSILDKDDTTLRAIAKGITRLSVAKDLLGRLKIEDPTAFIAGPIRCTVMHLIHIMATLHNDDRPRRVQAHHVFATRTGVATYINIRHLIMGRYKDTQHIDENPETVVDYIFSACIYLGMAILVTPRPYSENLAVEVGYLVGETASPYFPSDPEEVYERVDESIGYRSFRITGGCYYGQIVDGQAMQ
ncbi:hypothetical protein V8F20_007358 [Naviculisporaceae sp. PSN 640]